MATLTAPGVYVEEIPSGVRPIAAAGTSTAAFFGAAERGPIGEVTKIFSFTEYQALYGDFLDGGRYLAHAVYQFFNNGGAACYVGRVAVAGSGPGEELEAASVTVLDRAPTPPGPQNSLTFEATSPGAWGNRIMVTVDSTTAGNPLDQFNLIVYRDHPVPGEEPVELETFTDLSMNPSDPAYVENAVNSRSTYLRVVVDTDNTNQLRGYSRSGEITVDGNDLLGVDQRQFRININGDGLQTVDLTAEIDDSSPDLSDPVALATTIQTVIRTLTPLHASTDAEVYDEVLVDFIPTEGGLNGELRIRPGGPPGASTSVRVLDAQDPQVNAAGALNLGSRNGGTEANGSERMRPQDTPAGDFYFLGDDTVEGAVSAVSAGGDGTTLQDQHFIDALAQLDTIRDVSLIAVPGVGSEAVVDAAMNYCANRPLSDCFFIGDMAESDVGYTDATDFRDTLNNPNSYGAVYFPWLYTLDPTGQSSEPVVAPPSGFVAGLYSRIDGRRGVWKAPAGTEARIAGAVGLTVELEDTQHGDLNNHPKSVCVIRRFPTTGIVAWGARTVSSDPEYTYIPVRRTAIMLRVSIFNGIQWAVFEPNDEPLWAALRLNIGTFMNTLFRKGAFQGATPSEAYFVKCDGETTTQADIDLGVVNVLVGFAPLKPAEFVVVKIRQIAGQAP